MEVLLGIFLASLAGSAHCAAMCGPFLAFAAAGSVEEGAPPGWPLVGAYHLGRLVSYAAIGAAAGALGAGVERLGALAGINRAAAIVAGVLMVAWGLDTLLALRGFRARRWHAPAAMQRALSRVTQRLTVTPGRTRSGLTGIATALLPCGWLYAFVATAGGTGSSVSGILVMLVFWTGTLPVMVSVGFGLQRLAGPMRKALPVMTASVVVVIGLLTIAGRLRPPLTQPSPSPVLVHEHR